MKLDRAMQKKPRRGAPVSINIKIPSLAHAKLGNIATALGQNQEILAWYPRGNQGYETQTTYSSTLGYQNVRDLLARFFIETHFGYGKINNWRDYCIGVSNLNFGNDHGTVMPMFDYDGKNVKKVIRSDVKLLQTKYSLGDAWVYSTKRGFHVYFFSDSLDKDHYEDALKQTKCCAGFRRNTLKAHFAVLRISAKYTRFDIEPLYVLPGEPGVLRRMTAKGHTIRALLALGMESGAHLASLYPQWAHYSEDQKEWKPPAAKGESAKKGKRIRKVAQKDEMVLGGALSANIFSDKNSGMYENEKAMAGPYETATTTTYTITTTQDTTAGDFIYSGRNSRPGGAATTSGG
jgi:hypothetical protein